jgi:hypothetical protein
LKPQLPACTGWEVAEFVERIAEESYGFHLVELYQYLYNPQGLLFFSVWTRDLQLRQRSGQKRPASSFRRRQGLGVRARAVLSRHSGVCEYKNHLDQVAPCGLLLIKRRRLYCDAPINEKAGVYPALRIYDLTNIKASQNFTTRPNEMRSTSSKRSRS